MIPRFRKVLVGVDFSPGATNVPAFGCSIVEPGGEVTLVHVIEREPIPNPLYAHYTIDELRLPEKRRKAEKNVLEQMEKLVPSMNGGKNVTVHRKVVFDSDSADGILEQAEELRVDAIVLGRHGHGGLWDMLMGSVAERVLRNTKVPLLIIPSQ